MADVFTRLRACIETGEVLRIRYDGGSQAGATREITPLVFERNNTTVRARCYTSKAVKQFSVAKITILDDEQADASLAWSHDAKQGFNFESLAHVAKHFGAALEAKGWYAELVSDEESAALRLYGFFKNGNRRKQPSIVLSFTAFAYDAVMQADGTIEYENKRPRQRPWGLSSKEKTNTWSKLDNAVPDFLRAAGVNESA